MKRIISIFLSLLIILPLAAASRPEDVPNVHVADSIRFVSNPDNVLSAEAVARLDKTLAGIWRSTSAEPVVVVIDEMDPSMNIDDFATELFNLWGIGKKDNSNGLLFLVSKGDRRAAIRTGQGTEAVVPDVVAGRILRNITFPRFREGDYDGGVIATVDTLGRVMTDPRYAEELKSARRNNARNFDDDIDFAEVFGGWLTASVVLGLLFLIVAVVYVRKSRKFDEVTRYHKLNRMSLACIVAAFVTLGFSIPAWLIVRHARNRIRRGPRYCPNCHTRMNKLDEESDNAYLTPAQDAEERLNSVDYDVWLCPNCKETDILPFVNDKASYTVCGRCGARACQLVSTRELVPATTERTGRGVKRYVCRNCGNITDIPYTIPVLAAPVIIGGVNMGGGGGGGFGGGSFGGGFSAGGGASGGW